MVRVASRQRLRLGSASISGDESYLAVKRALAPFDSYPVLSSTSDKSFQIYQDGTACLSIYFEDGLAREFIIERPQFL